MVKPNIGEDSEEGQKLRNLLTEIYDDHLHEPYVMAVLDKEAIEAALVDPKDKDKDEADGRPPAKKARKKRG